MLEELSLTLPRFKTYENTLPMNRALEAALLDVYTEVICFYARAIHFFRAHPHVLLRRGAWEEFRKDFGRTVRRIKRMSSTVESEADLARMRIDEVKYKEVLDVMEALKKSKIQDDEAIKCHHIPFELNPRFWGREKALQAIKEALDPEESFGSLKAFALYGMGGVGKTQIALQYANRNRDQYDVILWVAADNTISMGQSFRDIARNLGLVKSDEEIQDAVAAILKVKSWFTETRKLQYWVLSTKSFFARIRDCPRCSNINILRFPLAADLRQRRQSRNPSCCMARKCSWLSPNHNT
jgi:hypothetical protein